MKQNSKNLELFYRDQTMRYQMESDVNEYYVYGFNGRLNYLIIMPRYAIENGGECMAT